MDKFLEIFSNLAGKLSMLSNTQKMITAVATIASVALVGGGAVVVSSLGSSSDGNVPETEIVDTYDVLDEISEETELSTELEETTEEVTEEATEEEKDITVSITSTSIYEDLKIKIINEKGSLVKGFSFTVIVASAENYDGVNINGNTYSDNDMDGIIHIKDLEGGDYVIFLQEQEGIIIKKNYVKASVKGELEYEKVDNENELQADKATEDTKQNDVVVEAVVQDTLPLLESQVIPTEVAKEKVDFSNFPASVVSTDKNVATLNKIRVVQVEPNVVAYALQTIVGDSNDESITDNSESSVAPLAETTAPETTEPETTEPETTAPETTESETTEPETTEPETTEPETTEPETTAPETTEPETTEPETTAPETTEPETTAPETTEPETTTPETTEPETTTPESTEGDSEPEDTEQPTKEEIVATATISLPKSVQMYYYGNDKSKTATITLEVTDASGMVGEKGINWSVSNKDIVDIKVAENNKSVTLTAKQAGTAVVVAKITYLSNEDGTTSTTEISCNVNVGDFTDNTTQIQSVDKETLYIDKEAKQIATPSSYTAAEKFYTTPKYTGWQTIDGKMYYYGSDYKPVTGEQVIGGVTYAFNSDGSLVTSTKGYGIDVSKWQGNIDWKAVAQSGVKFAVIRCAYRGSSDGMIHEDPYFKANIKGATQNGIKVGVYFFTQAINEVEAIEEASMAIALVKGYSVNLPIFIDTENATNGRANGLDVKTRTSVVKAFCETIRNSGYKPGIYASKYWYYNNLNMSQLSTYNIWVAQYNTSCNYTGRYDMWQYTSTGSVPGISGNVDLNICYTDY